jgi:hypothetical protein
MIHYHGGPINPEHAAAQILRGRHAMLSFADLRSLSLASAICQSFALDNGAFTTWKQNIAFDKEAYLRVVRDWYQHPGFDWALIPDAIDGDERDNEELITWWTQQGISQAGVPVWHLHESTERLVALAESWPRVAIGSSGKYATIGTAKWWNRMAEAMDSVCVSGKPITKLHGLRMLDPEVFTRFPFASADSTNIAKHVGEEERWYGGYKPPTKAARGIVIAERIEYRQSCQLWINPGIQNEFILTGDFGGV